MSLMIVVAVILQLVADVSLQETDNDTDREIVVLHTGNFRSSFESEKTDNGTQYGIARIIKYVKDEKDNAEKYVPIYIDTMDWAEGSILYSVFKWRILIAFIKRLPADVLAIGEAEMWQGNNDTERYNNFEKFILKICNLHLVCSNLKIPWSNPLSKCIRRYAIIERNDTRIAVVSVIDYKLVPGSFGGITVSRDAMHNVMATLKDRNVNVIIVVGHMSKDRLKRDLYFIRNAHLLIGGHGNLLFYNGAPPSGETPDGTYPTYWEEEPKLPVVYAGSYGNYVGRVKLTLNATGTLRGVTGNPVFMGQNQTEDEDAVQILNKYIAQVPKEYLEPVGRSRVQLNGKCAQQECNFGNLIADAFVDYKARKYSGEYWTDTPIALINCGAIKSNVQALKLENRTISEAQLMAAMPHEDPVVTLKINGSVLRSVMEHSVENFGDSTTIGFLQVSGIRIVYDLAKKKLNRVKSIKVRCSKCHVPRYSMLEDHVHYTVTTIDYIAMGNAGYSMLETDRIDMQYENIMAKKVVRDYIKYYGIVQTGTDERIIIENEHSPYDRIASKSSKGATASYCINNHFYCYLCAVFIYIYIHIQYH